jgi:hypothetical protein
VALLILRDRLPRSSRVWLHLNVVAFVGVVLPFTLFGGGYGGAAHLVGARRHLERRVPRSRCYGPDWRLLVYPHRDARFTAASCPPARCSGICFGVVVVLGVWQGVGGSHLTGQLMCFRRGPPAYGPSRSPTRTP